MFKNKIFSLLFFMSTFGWSNDSSFNLEELSNLVLNLNPKLAQVSMQKQMQIEQVDQVGVLPDPMITYSWFGENVETKVGPQEQRFGVQQNIPWPGKLIDQKELKRKQVKITETLEAGTRASLLLSVRNVWSDIQYLHQYEKIVDSTLVLYIAWSKNLLVDYKIGKVNYNRVLKMESEIDILNDEKKTIRRVINDKFSMLRDLTNTNEVDEVLFDSLYPQIAMQTGNLSLDENFASNFNIKNARAQQNLWSQQKQLSQKGFIPDFMIGFSYIQTGEAPGMPESGKDPWLINIGMSLPIYFTKTTSQINEAQIGLHKAETFEVEQKLEIQKQSQIAINQIHESIRQRKLYEESLLPKLDQSISVLESAYQTGKQDFMQLLDDYRQRLVIHKKIFITLKDEFQAKAKLLWLIGDESPRFSFNYQLPAVIEGEKNAE